MAETIFRGPAISLGSIIDGRVEPTDGPDLEYQATAFPDTRYFPSNKDGISMARIPGFLNNPYTVLCDNVPQSTGAQAIAANQTAANGTAFTLVTTAPGGGSSSVCSTAIVPLIPFQSAASALVSVLGIDLGFTTGTLVASNVSITVPDSTLFYVGQWIVLGGGGASNTTSVITQVATIPNATHITVTNAPVASLSNAPICSANMYGSQFQPNVTGTFAPPVATAVNPFSWAGILALLNPPEAICRNVTLTAAGGATGTTVTIAGYDIYGVAMTEVITASAGSTVAGKKAFKYIKSATPAFTDAGHNYSVGLGNLAGFNLRTDKWEYLNMFFNGTFATTSNGWLAGVAPASGDVRGTIDVSNASGFNSAFNGSRRLALMMSVPLWNVISATPLNGVPLFGQAQT